MILMQRIFSFAGFSYLQESEGFLPAEESNRRRDAEWIQYAGDPVCWCYLSGIIGFTLETCRPRTSTVQPPVPTSNMQLVALPWNIKLVWLNLSVAVKISLTWTDQMRHEIWARRQQTLTTVAGYRYFLVCRWCLVCVLCSKNTLMFHEEVSIAVNKICSLVFDFLIFKSTCVFSFHATFSFYL